MPRTDQAVAGKLGMWLVIGFMLCLHPPLAS